MYLETTLCFLNRSSTGSIFVAYDFLMGKNYTS